MFRLGSHLRHAAALLLAVLCLGTAAHLGHHLFDPDCGPDGRHGAQPCATCGALHHVPTPVDAQSADPPVVRTSSDVLAHEGAAPASRHSGAGSARAPPQV